MIDMPNSRILGLLTMRGLAMGNHKFVTRLLALCCLAGVFLLPTARSAQA